MRRCVVPLTLLLSVASAGFPAHAELALPRQTFDCALQQSYGSLSFNTWLDTPAGPHPLSAYADDAVAIEFLEVAAKKAVSHCMEERRRANAPNLPLAGVWVNSDAVVGSYNASLDRTTLRDNRAKAEMDRRVRQEAFERDRKREQEAQQAEYRRQQEAQQAEYRRQQAEQEARRLADEATAREKKAREEAEKEARKARLAADRGLQRQKFGTEAGIDFFVDDIESLYVNPYMYKGKVVAVRAQFAKMLAADKASFNGELKPLILDGVPTTRFTAPNQSIVLAFRFEGLGPAPETPVVDTSNLVGLFANAVVAELTKPTIVGRYAGAYTCGQTGCLDLLDK